MAAVTRLGELSEAGALSAVYARLEAEGRYVSSRTVRRWIEPGCWWAAADGVAPWS